MYTNFHSLIPAFAEKLNTVQVESISEKAYCKKYLQYLLDNRIYYLNIYADVLKTVMYTEHRKPEVLSLLDLGCGNGLLGLFASYAGFAEVYLNDLSHDFVHAARNLANQLQIPIAGYIMGNHNHLLFKFHEKGPDLMVGTDVIEHIYNVQEFFEVMEVINPRLTHVLTTSANPYHYFRKRAIEKLQNRDEYKGYSGKGHALEGEPHPPFMKMREDILKKACPDLSENLTKYLAAYTRGQKYDEIITTLNRFRGSGKLPEKVLHPTNTCHPITGSWTERLCTLEEYETWYGKAHFTFSCSPGRYDENKAGWKGFRNRQLNKLVDRYGIRWAPWLLFRGAPA